MPLDYRSRYAAQTEHRGLRMTLIGHWADLRAYYSGSDGNAWSWGTGATVCGGGWSCEGPLADFRATFSTRRRGALHES